MFAEKVFSPSVWFGVAFNHRFQTGVLVTGRYWHACLIQKGGRQIEVERHCIDSTPTKLLRQSGIVDHQRDPQRSFVV